MKTKAITAQSLGEMLEEMFSAVEYEMDDLAKTWYPFRVRVLVMKSRPPRHPFFDNFRDLGAGLLDPILEGEPLRTDHLVLVFPERHLSIHEIAALMFKIVHHPEADNFKGVDIITSSALLLTDIPAQMMRIAEYADDRLPETNGQ